jgi:hypothetical protein
MNYLEENNPAIYEYINSLDRHNLYVNVPANFDDGGWTGDTNCYEHVIQSTSINSTTFDDIPSANALEFIKSNFLAIKLAKMNIHKNRWSIHLYDGTTKEVILLNNDDEDNVTVRIMSPIHIKRAYDIKKADIAHNQIRIGQISIEYNSPAISYTILTEEKNDNIDLSYENMPTPIEELVELIDKSKKGLYVFEGMPGTGKTSYILQLAHRSKKKFVFLTSDDIELIGKPDFKNLILENKEIVLVIEDGEHAIEKRAANGGSNSIVSNLLNIIDGLTNKIAKSQVIVTHNTTYSKIDPAFLRHGRLNSYINFKPLTTDKANFFLKEKGSDLTVPQPTTLATLYDMLNGGSTSKFSNNIDVKANSIGFHSNK